jgi:hypothetical protein
MFAVSRTGAEAAAWISAPGGGTDGRLYVSVGDAAPIELRDSLGPIEAHGESPPKIAYGPDGKLYAIYVVARVVPGARFPLAALRFRASSDSGRTWSAPVTVTDDGDFGSHNFHALHVGADGTIYVAWLGARSDEPKGAAAEHHGNHGGSATFLTRSLDGGATWSRGQRIEQGEACPCCRTTLATAHDGTVYLAWRKVYAGNVRDIVVARSGDRGATWSEPVRVHADNWVFDGCPHAGPSLQVDGKGRVHIAWWTGKDKAAGVYYARSEDGAKSFAEPVALGVAAYSRPAHVQLALGGGDRVAAAWDDGTLMVPRIAYRESRDGGASFASPQLLSPAGRAAGFPVLAMLDTAVVVAWSEQSGASAELAAKAEPNMKDAKSVKGLTAVGDAEVFVRRGVMQ